MENSTSPRPTLQPRIMPKTNQLTKVSPISTSSSFKPSRRKDHFRRPLANQLAESTAQRVYNQLNQLATNKKGRMSQATARFLVNAYGVPLVVQGLYVIGKRRNIGNLTAFFRSWLQSESRLKRKYNKD